MKIYKIELQLKPMTCFDPERMKEIMASKKYQEYEEMAGLIQLDLEKEERERIKKIKQKKGIKGR